eukprot:158979_1
MPSKQSTPEIGWNPNRSQISGKTNKLSNTDHHHLYSTKQALAHRTSIDFCEAMAIRDALDKIYTDIQTKWKHDQEPPKYLKETNTIHLLTDSRTVLGWLSGEYRIRHKHLDNIIQDIQWLHACITETGYILILQWVKAHDNTIGNEIADRLAKKGLELAHQQQFTNTENWKYVSQKAANTYSSIFLKERLEHEWDNYMANTTYGYKLQDTIWSKSNRKHELEQLNRAQMDMLLKLRSGHDWTYNFQTNCKKKRNNDHCPFCYGLTSNTTIHTLDHLLTHCKNPFAIRYRELLKQSVQSTYEFGIKMDDDHHKTKTRQELDKLYDEIEWNSPITYLFPENISEPNRIEIIENTLHFSINCQTAFKKHTQDETLGYNYTEPPNLLNYYQ